MSYAINEIFESFQGEGGLSGTWMLFLRFAGCNLRCRLDTHGFDCDTEFMGSRPMSLSELEDRVKRSTAPWVLLTGGEPALQVDAELVAMLHRVGRKIAIETNGTKALPAGIDWVCVSPKTAEHTLAVHEASEVKYVLALEKSLPKPVIKADHYWLSLPFHGDSYDPEELKWTLNLIKSNPRWRLNVQLHKILSAR